MASSRIPRDASALPKCHCALARSGSSRSAARNSVMASSSAPLVAQGHAKDVMHVRRFGNDSAQVGTASDHPPLSFRQTSGLRDFLGRRLVGAIEQGEIRVEPFDERNGPTIGETAGAPRRHLRKDRRRRPALNGLGSAARTRCIPGPGGHRSREPCRASPARASAPTRRTCRRSRGRSRGPAVAGRLPLLARRDKAVATRTGSISIAGIVGTDREADPIRLPKSGRPAERRRRTHESWPVWSSSAPDTRAATG